MTSGILGLQSINSIRFVDNLHMLETWILYRRMVERYSKIPIIFTGKNTYIGTCLSPTLERASLICNK